MSKRLKIAVQKKGRLYEKSMALLSDCGIRISNGTGKLISSASNFPIDVLYLRNDDIPKYVEKGIADIGIVGENTVVEKGMERLILDSMGFSKCRLSLAVKREVSYPGVQYFQEKTVATSYPRILSRFFQEQGIQARIEIISGSVEIAPGIGLADAVCDIVSTGSTLLTNGLKEVENIFQSEAVLIQTPELDNTLSNILEQLRFRIQAYQNAKRNKYILLNAPDAALSNIISLIPGIKSPTIVPLAEKGWSSLHSVVNENDFWEVIDQLRGAGAEGILVVPIEKMIR